MSMFLKAPTWMEKKGDSWIARQNADQCIKCGAKLGSEAERSEPMADTCVNCGSSEKVSREKAAEAMRSKKKGTFLVARVVAIKRKK